MAKTIVTHNSGFHTDDIFAVATLLLAFPDEKFDIIRSRDGEVIAKGDFVVDVGHVYDPKNNRFDHHQTGGGGVRENGIPYASFGLVWKEFGDKICGDANVSKEIEKFLVMGIDAVDNGVTIYEPIFEDVRPFTIGSYLSSYEKIGDGSDEELYKTFVESVEIAKSLLQRLVRNEKFFEEQRGRIKKAYEMATNKTIIVLEKHAERFLLREVLSVLPEPVFVVYPSVRGHEWKAEGLPLHKGIMTLRKEFPTTWRGKKDIDLFNETRVESSVFCHNNGFMCVSKNRDGALELAQIALKS